MNPTKEKDESNKHPLLLEYEVLDLIDKSNTILTKLTLFLKFS